MTSDSAPSLDIRHIAEPQLEFGFGQKLEYPRDGLYLYGPVSSEAPVSEIHYGVIGTTHGVQRFRAWSRMISGFIPIPAPTPRSREIEPQHVPFPGFDQAFGAKWSVNPAQTISDIDSTALRDALRIGNRHEAIKSAVGMYVDRLIAAQNRLENPPSFWFVVIPEEVYALGRPQSRVARADRIEGQVTISPARARHLERHPTLFGEEEKEAEVYKYAAHFRRQLKARLLQDRIVTQIVRETTLAPQDFLTAAGSPLRRLEDPATVAWKLCTGAYYKAGGRPWQLADVRPGVCYVGLVYKRTSPMSDDRHACCAAQMFLTDGDGVVFRGALGPWYSPQTKQYHLDRSSARDLIGMVAEEYRRLHGGPPAELFIHARSAFAEAEWNGFEDGCPTSTRLVGVQIRDARDDLKLFRAGKYPVIRGTAALLTERNAFLWTAGYVPRLDTYMGPETLRDPLMFFMKFMLQSIDIYMFGIVVFDNYAPNHRKMDRPGKANAVMTRLNSRCICKGLLLRSSSSLCALERRPMMVPENILPRKKIADFIDKLYDGDLHAKRVLSLANATLGVLVSVSLAVHAIGQGLAQALGKLSKHGVKQVDRLLSNQGIDVWEFFGYWVPYLVGARTEVVVAMDWTSFARDGQDTVVLSMLTGHGRATPLMWRTVRSSALKGQMKRYEKELLERLREVMPSGVKVTVVADRGFGDCKLFKTLTQELGLEYVIRIRGDIYVTSAKGERRKAAQWVGQGGRSRTLRGARVTDEHGLEVGTVVCVHDRKMKNPWCLVASESKVGTRTLIRYYGKRWGIETSFRDIKDMRFGMGLSAMRVSSPQRRDRMLLLSALAIALLSLLGAAGESLGYDRWLKANTVKYRTHSLFRQGLMLYDHIPNWSDERVRPLMDRFLEMLMEQRVFKELFGVI